jgi:two-component system sensor histidine kinase CreC
MPGHRRLDRLYSHPRPGQERKSSGLGLCFVRKSVALNGGTLTIQNRTGKPDVKATLHFSRLQS